MQHTRRKLLALAGLTVAPMMARAFPGMRADHGGGAAVSGASAPEGQARVVSLGGGITEIVYALGAGSRLVGVDVSSVYPAETASLAHVGYYRNVPVEGVAALRPALVLASDQSGPDGALEQLRSLGIRVEVLPDQPDLPALQARIEQAARALDCADAGQALVARLQGELSQLSEGGRELPQRALSLVAHTSTLLMAGEGTAAHATLALAGFRNAIPGQQGYKPVTAESMAAAAPDMLVVTEMTVQAQGGMQRMLALPALAATPAVREGRVVVMADDLYLTFGPRLPQAVAQLRQALVRMPADT